MAEQVPEASSIRIDGIRTAKNAGCGRSGVTNDVRRPRLAEG